MKKIIIIIIFFIILLIALSLSIFLRFNSQGDTYLFAPIKFGTFSKSITVSGTLNPRKIVYVGTQVSGIIEKIYVKENSKVTKDMVIARLDKKIFTNIVRKNQAQADQLKARLALSKARLNRTKKLKQKQFASKDKVDELAAKVSMHQADYDSALANLERANIDMKYTDILSPVDGIVLDSLVETGQTVAASFQTPILFKIAEDLKEMEIEVKISESDIISIKKGQKAKFTISSLPTKFFTAKVDKVLYNPNIEQGVVTYNVILEVNDEEDLLRPGMSANILIEVSSKNDVKYIPTNALRFTPNSNFICKDKCIYVLNKQNKLEQIPVKIGLENDTFSELLDTKLNKDQKVIVGITNNVSN